MTRTGIISKAGSKVKIQELVIKELLLSVQDFEKGTISSLLPILIGIRLWYELSQKQEFETILTARFALEI